MLQVVTGPFHPDLELALVEEVRQLKQADPLTPLAVVVPSAALLQHLRELLVLQQGLPLLNVYFLTFHGLALRLSDEQTMAGDPAETNGRLELEEDLFFEYILSRVGSCNLPGVAPLRLDRKSVV